MDALGFHFLLDQLVAGAPGLQDIFIDALVSIREQPGHADDTDFGNDVRYNHAGMYIDVRSAVEEHFDALRKVTRSELLIPEDHDLVLAFGLFFDLFLESLCCHMPDTAFAGCDVHLELDGLAIAASLFAAAACRGKYRCRHTDRTCCELPVTHFPASFVLPSRAPRMSTAGSLLSFLGL